MTPRRVLIVDDDPDHAGFLAAALSPAEFAVEVRTSPTEALSHASALNPEVALLDVNMPEMDGIQLRDRLRALPGLATMPVVFVTGAESPFGMENALAIGRDPLLIKPVSRVELRRRLCSVLAMARQDVGPLPGELDRILIGVEENAETGILVASHPGANRIVVFQEGRIVFSCSTDPRDPVGQALVGMGMITEKQFLAAVAPGGEGRPVGLGALLQAMRTLSPEESRKVFEARIREAVLDIWMWTEGQARYCASGVEDPEVPFPVTLGIATIRTLGFRRRRRFQEAATVLPASASAFERVGGWPTGFPESSGDHMLAAALERGETLGEILAAFRGQSYAITMRIADLLRRGAIKTAPAKAFAPVRVADELMFGDPVAQIPTGLFARPVPMAEVAVPSEAEDQIEKAARARGLTDEASVELTISMQKLMEQQLPPQEAFILTNLTAGRIPVGDLIAVCPFAPGDVLQVLSGFLDRGTIKLA